MNPKEKQSVARFKDIYTDWMVVLEALEMNDNYGVYLRLPFHLSQRGDCFQLRSRRKVLLIGKSHDIMIIMLYASNFESDIERLSKLVFSPHLRCVL